MSQDVYDKGLGKYLGDRFECSHAFCVPPDTDPVKIPVQEKPLRAVITADEADISDQVRTLEVRMDRWGRYAGRAYRFAVVGRLVVFCWTRARPADLISGFGPPLPPEMPVRRPLGGED